MNDTIASARLAPTVAVGAVIWNAKGEVVLIRRGTPPRKGQWSIPGGRVEWGEPLLHAIVREVREETGLEVEILGHVETVDSVTRDDAGEVIRHYVLVDFAALAVAGELAAATDAEAAAWVRKERLGEYGLWSETLRIIEASEKLLPKVTG